MTKEIKGSIDYTIRIAEDGSWEIEYQRNIENEIAALSISQHVLEHSIAATSLMKKESSGKVKKHHAERLEKMTQARMGTSLLCDDLCAYYQSYQDKKEKHEKDMLTAEVTPEEVKMIKEAYDKVEKGHAAPDNHIGKP